MQAQLTQRAMELLALPQDGATRLLLDLGCGSGLSGETLTEEGHVWVVSARCWGHSSAMCIGLRQTLLPCYVHLPCGMLVQH